VDLRNLEVVVADLGLGVSDLELEAAAAEPLRLYAVELGHAELPANCSSTVRWILTAVGLGGGEQAAVREGGGAAWEEERAAGGRWSVRGRSRDLPTCSWEKGLEGGQVPT
jgi:hypothetical protein